MPPDLSYLWMPLLGCLVLVGIHAWLGIHVLARGVIFVDLALAQIAALGATIALYKGLEPEGPASYVFSLLLTLVGAGILTLTRSRKGRIPQEAVIGIVFAVASAASVVVMSQIDDVHGVEKIRAILLGRSIVWITGGTVLEVLLIYALVGAFHFIFRKRFLAVSLDPENAAREGLDVHLWDFLFYASFAVVITSSVRIAGVLLVFSFLIVPSVIGALFSRNLGTRLLIGWSCGAVASFVGLLLSYELPSGPVIVVTFGCILLLAGSLAFVLHGGHRLEHSRRVLAWGLGAGLLAAALLVPPWGDILAPEKGSGVVSAVKQADSVGQDLLSGDAQTREQALGHVRSHPDAVAVDVLWRAFQKESQPDLRIHLAEEGLRRHDKRFLGGLIEALDTIESPFFQDEALHIIERYTDLKLDDGATPQLIEKVKGWWRSSRDVLKWNENTHRFETS